jgi:hypothetical protein
VESISVGISPGYLDLGEIEPGSSKIVRFHLITSSDELFIVSLSASKSPDLGLFKKEEYQDSLIYYSEQDPSSWINFIDNPVELLPATEDYEETKGGGSLKGLREIKFIVNIPEDAEPGYHIGQIDMSPKIVHGDGPVSLVSVIPMRYIVKVSGKAIREGEIVDITTNGVSRDKLWLKIFYKNTGSVSTRLDRGEIIIFDKYGRELMNIPTSNGFTEPGEIEELNAFVDYELFEEESYRVKAKVRYLTGEAEREGTIEIPEITEMPTGKVTEEVKKGKIPLWLIIILIFIIVILIILFK